MWVFFWITHLCEWWFGATVPFKLPLCFLPGKVTERGFCGNGAETTASTSAGGSSCLNEKACWSTSTNTTWASELSTGCGSNSPSSAAHVFTFCRPESLKRWWRSVPWTQHSSHPRSAPPMGCRSPTWRTTARGTSLFITRKERWSPFPPSSGHDWHYTPTLLKQIWKLKRNLNPCWS